LQMAQVSDGLLTARLGVLRDLLAAALIAVISQELRPRAIGPPSAQAIGLTLNIQS